MKSTVSTCALLIAAGIACSNVNAQTAPPPAFGENTKGTPAIPEGSPVDEQATKPTAAATEQTQEKSKSVANNLLGTATIKESRRESGQIYRIELQHSAGSKQVIEENDSDGNIESNGIDLEDTPNLPKWKLGSW